MTKKDRRIERAVVFFFAIVTGEGTDDSISNN